MSVGEILDMAWTFVLRYLIFHFIKKKTYINFRYLNYIIKKAHIVWV